MQLCALSLDAGGDSTAVDGCRSALYNSHENWCVAVTPHPPPAFPHCFFVTLSLAPPRLPRCRCFDTCINLAVNETGGISVNWEHAWGDGHTMMHVTQLLLSFARELPPAALVHGEGVATHLPFVLTPHLHAAIARSVAAGVALLL